jgi:hypothetical protein
MWRGSLHENLTRIKISQCKGNDIAPSEFKGQSHGLLGGAVDWNQDLWTTVAQLMS